MFRTALLPLGAVLPSPLDSGYGALITFHLVTDGLEVFLGFVVWLIKRPFILPISDRCNVSGKQTCYLDLQLVPIQVIELQYQPRPTDRRGAVPGRLQPSIIRQQKIRE